MQRDQKKTTSVIRIIPVVIFFTAETEPDKPPIPDRSSRAGSGFGRLTTWIESYPAPLEARRWQGPDLAVRVTHSKTEMSNVWCNSTTVI